MVFPWNVELYFWPGCLKIMPQIGIGKTSLFKRWCFNQGYAKFFKRPQEIVVLSSGYGDIVAIHHSWYLITLMSLKETIFSGIVLNVWIRHFALYSFVTIFFCSSSAGLGNDCGTANLEGASTLCRIHIKASPTDGLKTHGWIVTPSLDNWFHYWIAVGIRTFSYIQ